jgi:uncharacterized membrane protein YfcA
MWTEYKKRFWTSQALILIVAVVAWQLGGVRGQQLVTVIVAMQLGALLGAWMGARMKRQIQQADDELPLNKR